MENDFAEGPANAAFDEELEPLYDSDEADEDELYDRFPSRGPANRLQAEDSEDEKNDFSSSRFRASTGLSGVDADEEFPNDEEGEDDALAADDGDSSAAAAMGPRGGRRKPKEGRGKRKKLTPQQAKLMGEANMLYIQNEFHKAAELLLQVVKQNPQVPDPFHTLGLIYSDLKQPEKAAEYFMIAAHMAATDAATWKKVAEVWRDLGQNSQAIFCYTRVIKLQPTDEDALYNRAKLCESLQDKRKAIDSYQQLLRLRPGHLPTTKALARVYFTAAQTDKAVHTLEDGYQLMREQLPRAPQPAPAAPRQQQHDLDDTAGMDLELVNMLAEAYMMRKQHDEAIEVLRWAQQTYLQQQHLQQLSQRSQAGAGAGGAAPPPSSSSSSAPQPLPLELSVNLGLCLLNLAEIGQAKQTLRRLLTYSPQEYGDMYFKVADEFMSVVGDYATALEYLTELLRHNASYDQPSIWLRVAQCHRALNHTAEAIEGFQRVFDQVGDVEACLALAELYTQRGDHVFALQLVDQYFTRQQQRQTMKEEEGAEQQLHAAPAPSAAADLPSPADIRLLVLQAFSYYHLSQYQQFADIALRVLHEERYLFFRKRRYRKRPTKRTTDIFMTGAELDATSIGGGEPGPGPVAAASARPQPLLNVASAPMTSSVVSGSAAAAAPPSRGGSDDPTQHIPSASARNYHQRSNTPARAATGRRDGVGDVVMAEAQAEPAVEASPPRGASGAGGPDSDHRNDTDAGAALLELASPASTDGHERAAPYQQEQQQLGRITEDRHLEAAEQDAIAAASDRRGGSSSGGGGGGAQQDEAEPEAERIAAADDAPESMGDTAASSLWTGRADLPPQSIIEILGADEYIRLVFATCKSLMWLRRVREAFRTARVCTAYILGEGAIEVDVERENMLRYQASKVAYDAGEYYYAARQMRAVCPRKPYNVALWNHFYKVISKAGEFTVSLRYLERQLARFPECVPLRLLVGHHAAMSASYSLALAEYFPAFQLRPNNPTVCLSIGLAYLNQVMSRKLPDRHFHVMLAFSFLWRYAELADWTQETYYNLGRAFQQLSLHHFAIPMYEKALQHPRSSSSPASVNLRCEIAYNLAIMYKASGAPHLARELLHKYLVV